MRCLACNCQLKDHESTRKYASSGQFVDLCDRCFETVEEDIPTLEGYGTDSGEEEDADPGYL